MLSFTEGKFNAQLVRLHSLVCSPMLGAQELLELDSCDPNLQGAYDLQGSLLAVTASPARLKLRDFCRLCIDMYASGAALKIKLRHLLSRHMWIPWTSRGQKTPLAKVLDLLGSVNQK